MRIKNLLLKKYGNIKIFMYMLNIYNWGVSFFWGVKKEMTFCEKIMFSMKNKLIKNGRENIIRIEKAKCKHNLFIVSGRGNQLRIGAGSNIENVEFQLQGNNNCLYIGKNVVLRDSIIAVGDNDSLLFIGDDTVIGKGAKVVSLESAKVKIGNDCLFSTNISIMNSDSHSIIDLRDNCRKNVAMDVNIGNHVWFGENVTVLKGVEIQDNVIIGSKSMVVKGQYQGNSIYAGFPIKLLRGGGGLVS